MDLSLKEIARLAGVSQATASRVLNHSRGVKESNRQKVLRVLEEHRYVPNPRAVNLALGREAWPVLALILPVYVTPYYSRLLDHLRRSLKGL
jgi:LacI family transcriptional regulator